VIIIHLLEKTRKKNSLADKPRERVTDICQEHAGEDRKRGEGEKMREFREGEFKRSFKHHLFFKGTKRTRVLKE